MNQDIEILCLQGEAITPYIPELAQFRLTIFQEYPYLYQGSLEYEYSYLSTYLKCTASMMVIARVKGTLIGVSTAIPLAFEAVEFQQPFLKQNLNINDYFYLGESVLLPAYRGQGIYRHFFAGRETAARNYGCRYACFCAVERSADHPRRPPNYQPLDEVWKHFGYHKQEELYANFIWQEIGKSSPSTQLMKFWVKAL